MNNKNKSRMLKGSVGLALLLGCSACTDTFNDHFDLSGNTETATLWEKIQADPELSDFAAMCERIHYRKNENDNNLETTYADLLNQSVEYTVFAPTNDALAATDWKNAEDNYTTVTQFMNNHIALYSNLNRNEEDAELTLLNKKEVEWNMAEQTLSGKPIYTANIAAANGVLHKMGAVNPFKYNLYEYIFSDSDLDSLANFLKYTEYKELTSYVQGPTVNGEVTYLEVDSTTYNLVFDNTSAYFNREDSAFLMVAPTNKAWEKALKKTSKNYSYRNKYYDLDGNLISEVNGDSLSYIMSRMSIIWDNIYNLNLRKDLSIEDYGKIDKRDSLVSTYHDVFYGDVINPLFRNGTLVDGLSNGYIYKQDVVNFQQAWQPENTVRMSSYTVDDENTKNVYSQSSTTFSYPGVEKATGDSTTVVVNAMYFQPTSNSAQTEVGIKLMNVLSGSYDVYAILLPDVGNSEEERKPVYIRPSVIWTSDETKGKSTQIYGVCTGNYKRDESAAEDFTGKSAATTAAIPFAKDEEGKDIYELSNTSLPDTVLLFKKITFPYCCFGLDDETAPVITLQSRVRAQNRAYFTNHFYIAGIYLKPCEEEDEE